MPGEVTDRDVRSEIRGRLGILTLDRPKALNALNLAMVERLDEILSDWAANAEVDAVVIQSSSERAFCAGGDVRSIGILPDPEERSALGRAFFGTEYRVNHRINTFPKPFIALMNGITMGGGLGLSVHGSHRVVSETLRMAMPETVLGLFPDVGGTWFLNRCPGAIGRYLAMVGPQIGAADALTAKLATNHVPGAAFVALLDGLAGCSKLDASTVEEVILRYAEDPGESLLADRERMIDLLFSDDDLDVVIAAVDRRADDEPWIAEAQAVLRKASPTSLRATWRRMVEGAGQTIEQVLEDDYRMAVHIVAGHDFGEGVRAILVDKDHSPRWNPATLAEVGDGDVDDLLTPLSIAVPL